jgi:hypothetical protein
MRQRLRIPMALAFAITGTAAVGAAVGAVSCDSTQPPRDSQVGCTLYCIPDGTDAGVCPEPATCSDAGACPAGCTPVA